MGTSFDRYAGCVLGLATGDALGAPHEGGSLERLVWRLIGRTMDGRLRWTDDTQMAIDLAESLLAENGVCPAALAQRFADGYHWSRGYGPGTVRVLKRIRRGESWETASRAVYAAGSYGNGAAMRAPVLALFFADDEVGLLHAAQSSALVTHAHPAGIEGAVLVALAAQALLHDKNTTEVFDLVQSHCATPEFRDAIGTAAGWLATARKAEPREVAKTLGNGIAAAASCPTALYLALRYRDRSFNEMMDFIIACRGDVDTIGAMAGALWGIANGSEQLPNLRLEGRDALVDLATRLFQKS